MKFTKANKGILAKLLFQKLCEEKNFNLENEIEIIEKKLVENYSEEFKEWMSMPITRRLYTVNTSALGIYYFNPKNLYSSHLYVPYFELKDGVDANELLKDQIEKILKFSSVFKKMYRQIESCNSKAEFVSLFKDYEHLIDIIDNKVKEEKVVPEVVQNKVLEEFKNL